jgi:hypothetical protein
MDIKAAEGRDVENILGQQLAEGSYHDHLGAEGGQLLHFLRLAKRTRLPYCQPKLERFSLDR